MTKKDLEQQALEKLLARATRPEPPAGSEGRLMARVRAQSRAPATNVVPLRRAETKPLRHYLGLGLPLAASLLLGIIVGNNSMLDSFLPESVVALVQGGGLELDLPDALPDADDLDGDLA